MSIVVYMRFSNAMNWVSTLLNSGTVEHYGSLTAINIGCIAMFPVASPIVINLPTRGLLAVETVHAIVQWLGNLNIKRNKTSMFVNKKHRYRTTSVVFSLCFVAFGNCLKLRSHGHNIINPFCRRIVFFCDAVNFTSCNVNLYNVHTSLHGPLLYDY